MLGWALTFLVIALIAAVLGLGGIAGFAVEIAKIIFFVATILFVISAVFASMMLAEQYFSCDMRTARSTAASVRAGPVTTKCMWIFVKTFGSTGARSDVTTT